MPTAKVHESDDRPMVRWVPAADYELLALWIEARFDPPVGLREALERLLRGRARGGEGLGFNADMHEEAVVDAILADPAVRAAVNAPIDPGLLGEAMARVWPVSFRGELASEPPASRALLMDYARRITATYGPAGKRPAVECTDHVGASWCPNHGSCRCGRVTHGDGNTDRGEAVDDCPLHGIGID